MKKHIILFLSGLLAVAPISATSVLDKANYEFTNYAEVQGCRFRMWVPPTTQKVKGVVVAFTQMQEWVSRDANLREACLLEDLAIVWADNLGETDYPKLEAGLKALADSSGMPEIANAPFATIAHSTAGIFCRTIASAKPERCFAVVQLDAVDFRDNEELKDVPWLVIKNGSEETDDNWEQASFFMVNDKEAYKNPDGSGSGDDKAWSSPRGNGCRMSLISIPGQGHFGWSPQEAKLVSTFIAKAAHYQLTDKVGQITRVPEENGWLTDTAIQEEPTHSPAAFGNYSGEPGKAFWHLDEEMANLWAEIHASEMSKATQTISQTAFQAQSVWQPSSNMDLSKGGIDTPYPTDAASSVSGNPIKVKTYYGIYKIENENEIFYSPARYGFLSTKDWLTFYQEGTDTERYSEVTTGQVSASNFPASTDLSVTTITDCKINNESVDYNATGSSDDWVVSGIVYKKDDKWNFDKFSSVPVSQVYIRHAGGNHNNLKETRFNITNDREAQTVTFDSSVPNEVEKGKSSQVALAATASGKNATVSFYLIGGPASLEGNILNFTGEEGIVKLLAIATGENNTPAKCIKEISVVEEAGIANTAYSDVKVYPTLVEDDVNVCNAPEGAEINLYDLSGRLVSNTTVTSSHNAIFMGHLSAGIYILNIDGNQKFKLIKK